MVFKKSYIYMINTRYFVSFNKNVILPNCLKQIHEHIIDTLKLPILNIYYRYFENDNTLLLLLHYPKNSNNVELFNKLFYELETKFDINMYNLTIFTGDVYDRSKTNDHFLIKGKEIYNYNINGIEMKCLVDSFLQPKLKIAIKMYNDIYEKIKYLLDFVELYGFGEDVLNFFNYNKIKNAKCYLHCKRTKMTGNGQKLMEFDEFINDAKNNKKLKILITTPGRNGFKNYEKRVFYLVILI